MDGWITITYDHHHHHHGQSKRVVLVNGVIILPAYLQRFEVINPIQQVIGQ